MDCNNHLLLCNKLPGNLAAYSNTHILSHIVSEGWESRSSLDQGLTRLQSRCESCSHFHSGSLTWLLAPGPQSLTTRTVHRLLEYPQDFAADSPQSEWSERKRKWERKKERSLRDIFSHTIQLGIQKFNSILTATPGVSESFIVIGLSPTRLSPLQMLGYPYFCPSSYKFRGSHDPPPQVQ